MKSLLWWCLCVFCLLGCAVCKDTVLVVWFKTNVFCNLKEIHFLLQFQKNTFWTLFWWCVLLGGCSGRPKKWFRSVAYLPLNRDNLGNTDMGPIARYCVFKNTLFTYYTVYWKPHILYCYPRDCVWTWTVWWKSALTKKIASRICPLVDGERGGRVEFSFWYGNWDAISLYWPCIPCLMILGTPPTWNSL